MTAIRNALLAAAGMAIISSAPAAAQERQSQAMSYVQNTPASEQPDVLLDIPNLSVEEITLEVDNVDAKLNLDARVANLVRLSAGADVNIGNVKLTIKGVSAQASLIVRLDNVRAIVERTLTTIEKNPEIIETLGNTINQTVDTTGGVLNNTLQTTGNVVGQTVGALGDLTQGVLQSGQVLNLAQAGLSTLSETVNAAGNTVRKLRASDGMVYEVVTDTAGNILRSSKVTG